MVTSASPAQTVFKATTAVETTSSLPSVEPGRSAEVKADVASGYNTRSKLHSVPVQKEPSTPLPDKKEEIESDESDESEV